jgi:histidinol-phosphate aminotransferase
VIFREHGGPDSKGIPLWDFSSNANACGPSAQLCEALRVVQIQHYPDPEYTQLRRALANFHQVDEARLVLAGSASEFVMRLTALLSGQGNHRVWIPPVAYGEYAHAAQAYGMQRVPRVKEADLCWLCDPDSNIYSHHDSCLDSQLCMLCDPNGPQADALALAQHIQNHQGVVVLDRAYEPLRLSGLPQFSPEQINTMWQLWSPNKALGLTGIRGAYAIAPEHQLSLVRRMDERAPSWILGSHAVEMLMQWTLPTIQDWLAECRVTLGKWKTLQLSLLRPWFFLPSMANFFCMKAKLNPVVLREHGIKLRDATSLGLPGYWRLSVQPPAAQAALRVALSQAVY